MRRATRICTFEGERSPVDTFVPPGTPCDRQFCSAAASGYGLFPWGASALCTRHLEEDMPAPGKAGER